VSPSARTDTGTATDYDATEEAALEAAVDQAWANYESTAGPISEREPARLRVINTTIVEWAGSRDRKDDGRRGFVLDNLDLARLAPAMAAARAARGLAQRAHPASSHHAVGWQAQIRQLTASQRGYNAAAGAGLTVSRKTLLGWLSDPDADPTAANREKIAAAYENLRHHDVRRARTAAERANHDLAAAFNDVILDAVGAEVRLLGSVRLEILD
jgi:hypothetical protein